MGGSTPPLLPPLPQVVCINVHAELQLRSVHCPVLVNGENGSLHGAGPSPTMRHSSAPMLPIRMTNCSSLDNVPHDSFFTVNCICLYDTPLIPAICSFHLEGMYARDHLELYESPKTPPTYIPLVEPLTAMPPNTLISYKYYFF